MDKISALMDGELDEHHARQVIARIRQGDLRAHWDTFHLIGDALRGDCLLSADFSERVAQRLAQEPTILAPHHRFTAKRVTAYALSAAASLAAVALVAWTALSTSNPIVTQPQIAQVQPIIVATPVAQLVSIPSNGKMTEYLLAHQGYSPSTAIQGGVPYIRSVSATQPARIR
jgi:sigma-E factor negative regulatory protein RseA